jgi:prevent-host-death family protein
MDEYMKAGEFKAECLKVMDRVKRTRKKVVITKRNIPVAKLVPIDEQEEKIIGKLKGTVEFKKDLFQPIDEVWDANS